jgi:predicted XRE-type DNA-binding protein
MKRRSKTGRVTVESGTRNVWADLGYPNGDEMLIKAQLVTKISDIVRARGLTQEQAAELLGLTQPRVSAILNGRFRGVSERRLMDCLTRLGRDVQIVVKTVPRNRQIGQLSVLFS